MVNRDDLEDRFLTNKGLALNREVPTWQARRQSYRTHRGSWSEQFIGSQKSQIANEADDRRNDMVSRPAEALPYRLQPHWAILCQYRSIPPPVEPDAERALSFSNQVFSFLGSHSRQIEYVQAALAAKAHPVVTMHPFPFGIARCGYPDLS